MSLPRFYLDPAEWDSTHPTLSAAESRHALSVLRLKPGDRIAVFNGLGGVRTAEVAELRNGRACLRAEPTATIAAPPQRHIVLVQALPKGKLMDWIVQKATELGAERVVPLLTERTVVRLDRSEAIAKRTKWIETAIEACKQCGRNRLPQIDEPTPTAEFFRREPCGVYAEFVASLEPTARSLKYWLGSSGAGQSACAMAFVGPEGDFTPDELHAIAGRGARPWSLGPIILRSETAALCALSLLAAEFLWDDASLRMADTVPAEGIEPTLPKERDFESRASASSATPA